MGVPAAAGHTRRRGPAAPEPGRHRRHAPTFTSTSWRSRESVESRSAARSRTASFDKHYPEADVWLGEAGLSRARSGIPQNRRVLPARPTKRATRNGQCPTTSARFRPAEQNRLEIHFGVITPEPRPPRSAKRKRKPRKTPASGRLQFPDRTHLRASSVLFRGNAASSDRSTISWMTTRGRSCSMIARSKSLSQMQSIRSKCSARNGMSWAANESRKSTARGSLASGTRSPWRAQGRQCARRSEGLRRVWGKCQPLRARASIALPETIGDAQHPREVAAGTDFHHVAKLRSRHRACIAETTPRGPA